MLALPFSQHRAGPRLWSHKLEEVDTGEALSAVSRQRTRTGVRGGAADGLPLFWPEIGATAAPGASAERVREAAVVSVAAVAARGVRARRRTRLVGAL